MCGRTACTLHPDQISKKCSYKGKDGSQLNPEWLVHKDKYIPSYNKAPQSYCPILLTGSHLKCDFKAPQRCLVAMKWGLIPSWVQGKSGDKFSYSTNNARSNTMLQKKSYRGPLHKGQRCVILADGFYEWKTTENGKQPYFIYFPQHDAKDGTEAEHNSQSKLLTMAGIFEKSQNEEEEMFTFTVITVDASSSFSCLHHRMPALLANENEINTWLDYENVPLEEALTLIKPKDCLQWHPVSKFVNNSRNNGIECIKEVDLSKKETSSKSPSTGGGIKKWLRPTQPQSSSSEPKPSRAKKHQATSLDGWLKKRKTE